MTGFLLDTARFLLDAVLVAGGRRWAALVETPEVLVTMGSLT